MKEKLGDVYDILFEHLLKSTQKGATKAEVQSVPEVARVLIELIILQSKM